MEEQYKEVLEKLVKFGKFSILDSTVEGLRNMNPSKRALRDIFLTEEGNKQKRLDLKERLKEWKELLSSNESIEDMIDKAQVKLDQSKELLNKNVKKALEDTKDLERAYRAMNLFFKNSRTDRINNLTILNASMKDLSNLDNDQFRNAVKEELVWAFGTLGKSDNYSFVVVPGFLGGNAVVKEWSRMARENKALLLTDFRDLSDHETVLSLFEDEGYPDLDKTNIVMFCNWLVGRSADEEVGEEDGVFVPPSAAVAGKMYDANIPISQPRAGKKYGSLDYVSGVRFKLLQENIGQLDEKGLVPMVYDFKTVMPYSAKTLSTADDTGLQTYSVVQVFDWVAKVVMDFLNQAGFERANQHMLDTYRSQIAKFLNSLKGKLIKDFAITKFEPDVANDQPDRILVHIVMDPLFPAKSFAIKMDGTKGDGIDQYTWKTKLEDN